MDTADLKNYVEDMSERSQPKIEEAKQQLGRINERVTGIIQAHPAACLLGALALGYLVARVARHQH